MPLVFATDFFLFPPPFLALDVHSSINKKKSLLYPFSFAMPLTTLSNIRSPDPLSLTTLLFVLCTEEQVQSLLLKKNKMKTRKSKNRFREGCDLTISLLNTRV
jgi:hypothetical protein